MIRRKVRCSVVLNIHTVHGAAPRVYKPPPLGQNPAPFARKPPPFVGNLSDGSRFLAVLPKYSFW
jgi:hypothetical protein